MKMNFFQEKDCDNHIQRPFLVYKMKIPKKWQIPLRKKRKNEKIAFKMGWNRKKEVLGSFQNDLGHQREPFGSFCPKTNQNYVGLEFM